MTEETYTRDQVEAITDYVDISAPPPQTAAYFIFGTNQVAPVDLVADRYANGRAPLIIVTGGVNRHNGIVEGREFRRLLVEKGVSGSAIRQEDESSNTQENVERSSDFLREAIDADLAICVVCKWYHRRAIHYIRNTLPEIAEIYAATFEPIYSGVPITRTNWLDHPDGKRRVLREWQEVTRRVSDGTFKRLHRVNGAWR